MQCTLPPEWPLEARTSLFLERRSKAIMENNSTNCSLPEFYDFVILLHWAGKAVHGLLLYWDSFRPKLQ